MFLIAIRLSSEVNRRNACLKTPDILLDFADFEFLVEEKADRR